MLDNLIRDARIGIIGLGYVGMPLAVAFAKKFPVIGFDIDIERVSALHNGIDKTKELTKFEINSVLIHSISDRGLYLSDNTQDLLHCNIYIVTAPTSITEDKNPDFSMLFAACKTIGAKLKKDDLVIFESTVYPGATEEECVPILEQASGLMYNCDFFVGYSPERINPGDKKHRLTNILKITSGSTPKVASVVDQLYKSIISAGTFSVKSIKVAEAAKVIENVQRDVNIALVNEFSRIFNLINIDSNDVLEAASTKWNFLNFKPGLVGGNCIGVNSHYLIHKAETFGYYPEITAASRKVNDDMGRYVSRQVIKLMIEANIEVRNASVLILGFTFKENCTDIRNTKVIDIVKELQRNEMNVTVYDPWANKLEVLKNYNLDISNEEEEIDRYKYDVIVLTVSHDLFSSLEIPRLRSGNSIIYDVKGFLNEKEISHRL